MERGERANERPADRRERRLQKLEDEQRAGAGTRALVPPIHLNLNIDGRALAAAVSEQQASQSKYDTSAPDANGTALYGP
jgi:hypothetical protein